MIPEVLTRDIINCVHSNLGHPGVYKTAMYIRRFYFWRGMNNEIKKWVTSCDLCQRVKSPNIGMSGRYEMVESKEPGDLVSVDFYGPLPRSTGGVEYIFVILDVFSKYIKLYPIKRETTEVILGKLFNSYIPEMGKPKRIISDHGTQFTSPKWEDRLRREGIDCVFSTVRHPQSNPVERVMRELGRLFRTLCADKHTRWARCVADIEFFLNVTTHLSTGYSPCELHFGKGPTDRILQIINFPECGDQTKDIKIMLARSRMRKNFETRARAQGAPSRVSLKVGDLVLLRVPKISDAFKRLTRKFFHLYYGPYKIIKDFGNNAYRLVAIENDSRIIGVYNRSSLKKYIKFDD